jgi:hypothetical protein
VGSGVAITQTSGSPNFVWQVSDLPVGAGGVITLTGIVTVGTPSALSGQIITNTAVIAASNDITTTNNSASAAPYRLCGPGYWLETVTNSCQLAQPDRYVPDFGYTEFFLCPLGTFQPASGASSCLPAPVDTYVDFLGAAAPIACPAGTNNPMQGSASVSACLLPLTGDIVDSDPLLGPLTNNGGSTFTRALLPGSPAIDAGNCASGPATDQRGVARPQDATCDMGAVEETGTLQCGIAAGNSYPFPTQSGVSILVNSESDLDCLYVDRLPFNHPHATGLTDGANLRTGQYWQIRGLQADGITPATTFNVDLTLPYASASASTRACKWLDGVGPGFGWNCGPLDGTGTTVGAGAVTRLGVTAFSQWAVGDDVGPTAVTLNSLITTNSKHSSPPRQ